MHPSQNEITLELSNLHKAFGEVVAVDQLSLRIQRGEVFGFLGPNGAGKTTTIKMICGLLKPDAGEIWIDEHNLAEHYRACKEKIGLCPEDLVIWKNLTALEQLVFTGQQYDLSGAAAKAKAADLLDRLGLAEHGRKLASQLSGGMKRRLNIALALVHDPQILILDEPQAGLDPQSRVLVREYIRSLSEEITVILTSHEMEEVDRLADRVGIIDHGEMLVVDTPEALKNRIGKGDILEITVASNEVDVVQRAVQEVQPEMTVHRKTIRLVDIDPIRVLPPMLDTLRGVDVQIEDISIRKKTLEDVFIDLTGRGLRE